MRTVSSRNGTGIANELVKVRRDPADEVTAGRTHSRKITPEIVAELLRDPEVQSKHDMAERIGVHPDYFARFIRDNGIDVDLPRTRPETHKHIGGVFGHEAWNKGAGVTDSQFTRAHALNLSIPQMADYLKISETRVWFRLNELELKPHGKRNPAYAIGFGFFTDEDIRRGYSEGLSLEDTAKKFQVPKSRVKAIWKANGYTEYIEF